MRILLQHFARQDRGGSGGFVNLVTLVRTTIQEYPQDEFVIVCSETSPLRATKEHANVKVLCMPNSNHMEFRRLHLLLRQVPQMVEEHKPDLVWSFNLGLYVHTRAPQVVSLVNAFQVYPPALGQYHPSGPLHTAFLRWFTRRSLRASDAVIVETGLMGEYVRKIRGAPSRILVAPKAVGPMETSPLTALPAEIARIFDTEPGPKTYTFLFMANALIHKNHATLVAAMDILRSMGCKARLALSLTAEELVALGGTVAESLIGDGYILPLGVVKVEYLRSVYDMCDGCVMPSMLESQSSSHLESMQWGKPQIAADLPYAHDICRMPRSTRTPMTRPIGP